MKEFFGTIKFKILLAIVVVLTGVMTYAAANGRLTAAPQELLGAAAVPFQKLAASISRASESFVNKYILIDKVAKENEELKQELIELREQMVDYDAIKAENEQLRKASGILEENPSYEVVNANVIGRDALEKYYSFTIDKGMRHGVEVKDCVISGEGIVGRVIEVGPNYAKVSTILDPSVSVGAIVSRTRDNGLIGGNAKLAMDKKCAMTLLARDTLAAKGDKITTTGLGGIFPKGLLVGTVEEILPETSGTSMYAVIEPITNIESIKMVMVITDFDE
ncbi:MAG: rod shape-determining protein MreC [Pygmaiobacter sp.]